MWVQTMKTLIFRSIPENWKKEYLGLKCNTVRKTDTDVRFQYLEKFIKGEKNKLAVKILNTKTGEAFERVITDVTMFKDFYIISWKHNE